MPNFDLNNPAQFNQLASGGLTEIASAFGLNPNDWDIQEGSYNGVPFHVFKSSVFRRTFTPDANSVDVGPPGPQPLTWNGALPRITDSGGRRKVKYQFPYRDGQTTDDLGRRAGGFEADVVLFGTDYIKGYNALIAQFNKPTPGTLLHPIFGKIACVVDTYQITHQFEQRKAMALRINFIEHNYTIGDITAANTNTFKTLIAGALAIFKAIDTVINTVNSVVGFAAALKNLITNLTNSYKLATAVVLSNMNQTFNASGSSADIPSLLPVNIGGTGKETSSTGGVSVGFSSTDLNNVGAAANSTLKPVLVGSSIATTDNFLTVRSINDPFNGIPVSLLNSSTIVALAVTQVTQQVQQLRNQAAQIIKLIEDNGGALDLFDSIQSIRQSVVQIQLVLEAGVASSNAQVVDYTTPRLMSLREVAFANGLSPDSSKDIDLLNPSLDSVNYIPKGVTLKVPIT